MQSVILWVLIGTRFISVGIYPNEESCINAVFNIEEQIKQLPDYKETPKFACVATQLTKL